MEKKYTFIQELVAAFAGTNVKWYYANKVERMKIMFDALSEDDKREFLKKLAEDVKIKV